MKITKFRVNGQEALVAESALAGQFLPTATATDAGKAVVVGESGGYELAEAGGVEPVVVTVVSGDAAGTGTWSGATWEKLITAFNHNAAFVEIPIGANGFVRAPFQALVAENESTMYFTLSLDTSTFVIYPNGTVVIHS